MVNVRCPNCQATYQLDPAKLADGGRKLKCAQCGTVWVARAEQDIPPAPEPVTIPEPVNTPVPETPAEASGSTQEAAPSPEPEVDPYIPPAEDPLIQRAPEFNDLTRIGGWRTAIRGDNLWRTTAIAFCLLGLAIGGVLVWSHFTAKDPETTTENPADHLAEPTTDKVIQPPTGIILHRVRGEVEELKGENDHGGISLTVRGLLTNTTSDTLIAPPMRLELLGTDGNVADMWPVTDTPTTLSAGADQAWSVSLTAPDMASVRGWRVVFIEKGTPAPFTAPPAEPSPTVPEEGDAEEAAGHGESKAEGHAKAPSKSGH